ncbi:hypothetical protein PAERUG_P3_North_West_16_VIM_2_07_06_02132 [Pseudomonas aeruginosa]|nr:hypothetical protein CSC32_0044 [Pseudomonas aeruginosa]ERV68333.1 hypothetical protein Q041_07013 [Pseudomonas aeruginosa BWHPSA028]RCG86756.1 hypothetical protein CSB86_4625 [Pseudomonas aeruginosa]RCH39658.1 hypothetical protein CSC45_6278 [Pseudomonas aeruginosa]CRN37511.1 hypothetical protein PAERUG_P23_East_of_England_6_IMP_13_07_10_01006 [Pseudomonas aeruginosa]
MRKLYIPLQHQTFHQREEQIDSVRVLNRRIKKLNRHMLPYNAH